MNDLVVDLVEKGGYWGIAFLSALENVFPPIPSELIMGLGGIEAGQGSLNIWLVILAGSIGTLFGNYFWYWVGWRYDQLQLTGFIHRHGRWLTLDTRDVERLDALFNRYGLGIIFVARFLPAIRTMISLPAGLFNMPLWKFTIATFIGSLIWNGALAAMGYWLGRRFHDIDAWLGIATWVVIGVMAAAYIWRVATWTPRGNDAS